MVYAVYENNNFYEIITGKKIYMLDNNIISEDVLKDDFNNKHCSLIGVSKEVCKESDISIYLRFSIISEKIELITDINEIELSISNIFYKSEEKTLKK